MSKNIQKYLCNNIGSIVKLLIVFGVGIAIGFLVYSINGEYKEGVKAIMDGTRSENYNGINIILNGIKNNSIIILIMYLSLLTYISPAICGSLIFLKGCITSIYSCALIYILGIGKGMLFVFLTGIIPSIFSLASYILISIEVSSIYTGLKNGKKASISSILKSIYILLIAISLICFSIVLEQVFSQCMVDLYGKI